MKLLRSFLRFVRSERQSDQKPSFLPTPSVRSPKSLSGGRVVTNPARTNGPVETLPTYPPGNFYSFDFFIEVQLREIVNIGYPKVPLRDMTSGNIRWGSKMEWSWPDPSKPRQCWIDDEQAGLAQRRLEQPEDALGAEGRIGDMRLRFEQILDLGENQIVYALYCPDKQIRLAYGFNRLLFEPSYKSAVT